MPLGEASMEGGRSGAGDERPAEGEAPQAWEGDAPLAYSQDLVPPSEGKDPAAAADDVAAHAEGLEAGAPATEVAAPSWREEPETSGQEVAAPSDADQPRRSRAWLWAVVVLVAAAMVGVFIGTNLGGRQGGPLGSQPGGNGRPTIVVGTVAVAPPSVASVASPSAAPATVVAGATAVAGPRQYIVQPGDTLRSIAQDQYGDAALWPRIYQANRDVIGPDPDALVAGTTLQIPPQ
jgi:nucleoid-associated protein YgaU